MVRGILALDPEGWTEFQQRGKSCLNRVQRQKKHEAFSGKFDGLF